MLTVESMSDDEGPVATRTVTDTVNAKYTYTLSVSDDCEFDGALFRVGATVSYEGVRVGSASGCLVIRDSGWDFWEVCDSVSQELCDVANDLFGDDSYGRLVRDIDGLSSAENASASKGGFLHIEHVTLDASHRGADIGLRCLYELLSWLKCGPAGLPAWTIAALFPAPDPCADPNWRSQRDKEETAEEKEKSQAEHKINVKKIRAQWARLGFVRKSMNSNFSYLLPSRITLQPKAKDIWAASLGSAVSAGAISQDVLGRLSGELTAVDEGERLALIESQLQRLRAGDLEGMLSAKQSVRFVGLAAKPELNGTPGMIVSFVSEKGRYAVQPLKAAGDPLPMGAPICVKPANIEMLNAEVAVN